MRPDQAAFFKQIETALAPVYFVYGAETLLVEEALDRLRAHAKQAGYSQRERYTYERGFAWEQLLQSSQTVSLFDDKRVLELRLGNALPGAGAVTFCEDYQRYLDSEQGDPGHLLIISANAIDKRSQNTKWFKAIQSLSVCVDFPLVPVGALPDWISQRLSAKGLSYSAQVPNRLTELVEGNLLAAQQAINLLALLFAETMIGEDELNQAISDHARFDIFKLVDTCLLGDVEHSIRILLRLKQEQIEPIVMLWALAKDVRILCQLARIREQRPIVRQDYQRLGVWQSRQALFQKSLGRLDKAGWQQLLLTLDDLDRIIKGQQSADRGGVWGSLEDIVLQLSGVKSLAL